MTGELRSRIEQAWGRILYDVYGTTESGMLAAECGQHRGMHLFEDQAIVEVVDGLGRPVPAGQYGEKVLLTLLFRRTQPLIRYEVSDMVRLSANPCTCLPFRVIDSVQGRMDEVVYLPSTSGGAVAIHPIVFRRVLNTLPCGGWELVHEEDRLSISISGMAPEFGDVRITEAIAAALRDQGAVVPLICVKRVKALQRGATGKAPLIRTRLVQRHGTAER